MSEYWKSTPKYWCKHCKIFIRDTKLERSNHEATPKHQGNLKRFLRDLHRGHEKEEKDQQRAKNEVARLNGMVASGGAGPSSAGLHSAYSNSSYGQGTIPRPTATAEQIKKQREQLAELGVAVPDEFRPDLAITGDWKVVSERIIDPEVEGEQKPDARAIGVRKREDRGEEEEEIEAKKMRYGSRYRVHPVDEDSGDLDALLSTVVRKDKNDIKEETKSVTTWDTEIKQETKLETSTEGTLENKESAPTIKVEPIEGDSEVSTAILASTSAEEVAVPGVIFKKRKAKNIRQK